MTPDIRRSLEERDQGFTLVEVLVVIAIIGMLAAIAIPVFLNQRKKGYQASEKSDLHTVATELETYYTDHQTYSTAAITGAVPSITVGDATSSDPVTLSAGNTVVLAQKGDNGYCLTVTSSKSASVTYVYNSLSGGLQPATVTTCALPSGGAW